MKRRGFLASLLGLLGLGTAARAAKPTDASREGAMALRRLWYVKNSRFDPATWAPPGSVVTVATGLSGEGLTIIRTTVLVRKRKHETINPRPAAPLRIGYRRLSSSYSEDIFDRTLTAVFVDEEMPPSKAVLTLPNTRDPQTGEFVWTYEEPRS